MVNNFNPGLALQNIKYKDDADTIAEDLYSACIDFQENLGESQELGAMLASFGQSVTVQITGIGYKGAKLIKFTGYLVDNGTPVELLQHVNQLNFLLLALPKDNPTDPRKKIGFIQED